MNVYDKGDLIRCSASFRDASGALADPANVFFRVKQPNVAALTLPFSACDAVIKDAPGVYHCDVSASVVGEWWYRWDATGSGQAAHEEMFLIRKSQF